MTEATIAPATRSEARRLVALATQTCRPDRYAGKRKATRFKGTLWMEFSPDPLGDAEIEPISTHDFSEGGVSFWLRKKVESGAYVYLRDGSDGKVHPWLKTRVTHCTNGLKGFLIGGLFEFEK